MKKYVFFAVVAAASSLMAEGEEREPKRWSLTLGPAWRATVKSSVSGFGQVSGVTPSHTTVYDKDIAGHGEWTIGEVVNVHDPDYVEPTYRKYAATRTATETTVSAFDNRAWLDGSDTDRPLGVKAGVGYDFYSSECFSVGAHLMFAAYWNMRSSASGFAGGGTVSVRQTTDYYLFNNGPIPDDTDFSYFRPESEPYAPYREQSDLPTESIAGSFFNARIRSDLYQLGLGPQATWHVLDWLDVYGRVSVLCNLAHMNFDAGISSSSETKCLIGVGGVLGCSAFFTDNFGLFAEIGYEWIDKAESDIGGANAEVDFSSLILSAGLQYRF